MNALTYLRRIAERFVCNEEVRAQARFPSKRNARNAIDCVRKVRKKRNKRNKITQAKKHYVKPVSIQTQRTQSPANRSK